MKKLQKASPIIAAISFIIAGLYNVVELICYIIALVSEDTYFLPGCYRSEWYCPERYYPYSYYSWDSYRPITYIFDYGYFCYIVACVVVCIAFIANIYMAVMLFLKKKNILLTIGGGLLAVVNILMVAGRINFGAMFEYASEYFDNFWTWFLYFSDSGFAYIVYALTALAILFFILVYTIKPLAKFKSLVAKIWFIPGALFLLVYLAADGIPYIINFFASFQDFDYFLLALPFSIKFFVPILAALGMYVFLPLSLLANGNNEEENALNNVGSLEG